MDYKQYSLSARERMRCMLIALALGGTLAYLFYNSWFALALIPVLYVILRKRAVDSGIKRRQEELAKEFLDTLRTISASLLAGMSMENAWKEAEKEIGMLYGDDSCMYLELEAMNHSVALNIPLEQLLEDFAMRTGNADISSFSEVFAFAKRSGGNFVTIIEGTTEHMRAQYDTEREIQVLVASRKMEQRVMNVVPIFILAYLKVTSAGFLDVLYGNIAGVLFMTVCLAAYGGIFILAEKILDIRV